MEVVNCLSFTSERAPPKKSASAIPSIAFYGSANSNSGSRPFSVKNRQGPLPGRMYGAPMRLVGCCLL